MFEATEIATTNYNTFIEEIIGFGFGSDDEHINGIIRTLIYDNNQNVIVVILKNNTQDDSAAIEEIGNKLKVRKYDNIQVILVNEDGYEYKSKKLWIYYSKEMVGWKYHNLVYTNLNRIWFIQSF